VDGNVRLSATVISCSGAGNNTEKDDFYFNGNFANCHNTQSIQLSFEKAANNYVFAVSDSIGFEDGEINGISAIREIKKYHESAKLQQFTLESITEKIYEAVQLSSNLIYSQSVIASQSFTRLTGFSSLIIDNNRAAIMNLGNNGAFLFRQGQQKELFSRNNNRKSEKLKSLGISPSTPDIYDTEAMLKLAEEESKTKIKLSPIFEIEEDDLIILCSDGLLNGITKSRLEAVANSGFDPSKMASVLFQEASKNGTEDGITVMVIKVEEIRSLAFGYNSRRIGGNVDLDIEPEEDDERENSGSNIVNYILGFVCVLVISGVLFMGYLIISNSDLFGSGKDNDVSQASLTTDSTSVDTGMSSDNSSSLDTSSSDSLLSSDDSKDSSQSDNLNNDNSGGNGNNQQDSQSGSNGSGNNSSNSNANSNDEYEIYVVKSGDTLSSISNKYYGNPNKYDTIMKFNNIKKDTSLYVGQELKIPKLD